MAIDLTSPVNDVLALLLAAVSAAIPILVPAILKRIGVANDADLSGKLATAADAAAGAAYNYALQHDGGLSKVEVQNASIATGVNYVVNAMPDTLAKLGVTPDKVAAMVSARLGALLAQAPAVSAGPPAKAPFRPMPTSPTTTL